MTWLPPLWLRWAFTYVPPERPECRPMMRCQKCGKKTLGEWVGQVLLVKPCGCDTSGFGGGEWPWTFIGNAAPEGDLVFTPWYWIRRVLSL